MNRIQVFTADLKAGYRPKFDEMIAMLYELQAAVIDTPEFLWMEQSPETLADCMVSASRCVDDEPDPQSIVESADDWMDRRRDDALMAQDIQGNPV